MKRSLALVLLAVLAMSTLLFAACDRKENEQQGITVAYSQLTSTGKEENTFAELFSIEHLKDENEKAYSKIEVFDKEKKLDTSWLLLPEGVDKVSGAPAGVNIMTFRDRQNIMVSSASTMALINAMDALSKVPMTTADTTWRIQEIKDAIDKGTVKEVGKYSKPDYEQIISIGAEKTRNVRGFFDDARFRSRRVRPTDKDLQSAHHARPVFLREPPARTYRMDQDLRRDFRYAR